MAEETAIAWTHSTFNPWIGCEPISPGCKNCYAEAYAKRVGRDFAERTRTGTNYWKQPHKWNAKAAKSGRPWRVFCASLADVFDNKVPPHWRWDLWDLIAETPALTWLILTKRIGNARTMLPVIDGQRRAQPNVWLGATIVNQEEADRDLWKLIGTPAAKHFVSYEPALGPIDWAAGRWLLKSQSSLEHYSRLGHDSPHGVSDRVDMVIFGGESGHHARTASLEWARSTMAACEDADAAFFMKQTGAVYIGDVGEHRAPDRAGAEPDHWPADLRVRQFPGTRHGG